MPSIDTSRRNALKLVGGATVLGLTPTIARAAEADPDEFERWFSNVENYDGVVDATGQPGVSVTVGSQANGGAFGFSPAAVRVDPGATVTWTWSGEGGVHDVSDRDGDFGSDLVADAGATFEHTFDTPGVYYYVCTPHEPLGMKGAIVVGDVEVVAAPTVSYDEPYYGDWFDGTPSFAGTVDATGQDEVRVTVGDTVDGQRVLTPAAVRVDPGATVVWEAVDGETHELAATDGSWTATVTPDTPAAMTFDGDGVTTYECTTHTGERGAIVVGAGGETLTTLSPLGYGVGGGLLAAVLAALGVGVYYHIKDTTGQEAWTPRAGPPQ